MGRRKVKSTTDKCSRALGALIAIDISNVLAGSNEIKVTIAEDCPDIDDRVLDNYSLLISMAEEVKDK